MKILIVVDMQNDFVYQNLRNEDAIKIINNVVLECKKYKKENIFFTQDTHDKNYLKTQEGINLPIIHCVKNTNGWKIIDELNEFIIKENIIRKKSFGSIKLINKIKNILKTNKKIEITLIGTCTDICVISNAILLKSAFPDILINVKENCCAGTNKINHNNAIKTMQCCQIKII